VPGYSKSQGKIKPGGRKMNWDNTERRKFPRIKLPCKINLKREDSVETISTTTENISCGGVCIILPQQLGVYTSVGLTIDLGDGGNPIQCKATIVWSLRRLDPQEKDYGFFDTGIEFSNLSQQDISRIAKIVQEWTLKEKS